MPNPFPQRVIWSLDGRRRALIVLRGDGSLEVLEEEDLYDDENDVWYCTGASRSRLIPGIYQTAELAERDIRSMPPYRLLASN